MRKIVVTTFFILWSVACGTKAVEPNMFYRADFDNTMIDVVDSILVDIADRYNLEVFKHDNEEMKILSQGEDAFFTALYSSNIGGPHSLDSPRMT